MSLRQRDYLLRMIDQLAQALARIAAARKAGKLDEAAALLDETANGLLGPLRSMVDAVDAASAAMLLGSPEKTAAYAALVAEEAALREATGDARAASGHRRALELYLEAARSAEEVEPRLAASIREIAGKVDARRLAPRYQEALARLGAA